jgi:uncharacterized protein (TIGR02145 family)
MRKSLLYAIVIGSLFSYGCNQQDDVHFSCSYYGESNFRTIVDHLEKPIPTHQFGSRSEAEEIIEAIVNQVGLLKNFEIIQDDDIANAAALLYRGQRYIIYNNAFMETAEDLAQNHWSVIGILAHEVGHHLQGHTLLAGGSRPELELEADRFAGFILAKMSASLEDAQKAVSILASETGSSTHPPKSQRLNAIAEGFKDGFNGVSNRLDNPEKPNQGVSRQKEDVKTRANNLRTSEVVSSAYFGESLWMTENLNTSTFRNGDTIFHARSMKDWYWAYANDIPAWCFYQNNKDKGKVYGKLYNLDAVRDPRGLAPNGWHVATIKEWKQVIDLFVNDDNSRIRNEFAIAYAGYRGDGNPNGYESEGSTAYWWTQDLTDASYDGFSIKMKKGKDRLQVVQNPGQLGFSVRCVKDR